MKGPPMLWTDETTTRDAMPTILVYTEIGCAASVRAKEMLRRSNVFYTEICLDLLPQYREELKLRSAEHDVKTPQIYIGSLHVGGLKELQSLLDNNELWDDYMERAEQASDSGPPSPSPLTDAESSAIGDLWTEFDPSVKEEFLAWSPDEYTKLVNEFRKTNVIKDHRPGLIITYKSSFKGEQFVEWMIHAKKFQRKEALEIGQELLDRQFAQQSSRENGATFSPDRYYQLVEDDENKPLNCGIPASDRVFSVAEYNEKLVEVVKPVLEDIVDEKIIHYDRLVDNDHYSRLLQLSKELQKMDPSLSTPQERTAVFVNIHNIMLVHMIHKYGPPQSVWQRRKYLNTTYYQIYDHKYSLQSIVNGILRSNRKGLGMLWKSFGSEDERLPLVVPDCNPLIHFALITGTKSSPPLRAYSAQNVYEEMAENARLMLLNSDLHLRIDNKKNVIYLSKIFKWYSHDFGVSQEKIIEWILNIIEEDESEKSRMLRIFFYTGDYSIDYLSYDWTFNGQDKHGH